MSDEFQFAKALHAKGQYEEAIVAYQRLLEQNPEDFQALNNLGTLYEEVERFGEALKCYLSARELAPDASMIQYNVAHVLYRQERFESAVSAWELYLQLQPESAEGYFNLGTTLVGTGDYLAAKKAYQRAVTLQPELQVAHSNLGALLVEDGQLFEAEAAFRRAVLAFDTGGDHFELAKILELKREYDEAESHYRRSLELVPESAETLEHLIHLLVRTGQQERALDVCDLWLSKDPEHPIAVFMRESLSDPPQPRE